MAPLDDTPPPPAADDEPPDIASTDPRDAAPLSRDPASALRDPATPLRDPAIDSRDPAIHPRDPAIDALLEHGAEALIVLDRAGRVARVSANAARVLGDAPESGAALTAASALAPGAARELRLPGGGSLALRAIGLPFGGRAVLARDASAERAAQAGLVDAAERLAEVLARDELTGLANRARLLDGLARAAAAGRDAAVLLLDLDRFRSINEVHGHETGDDMLRAIGARLAEFSRGGALAARLGADEFALLAGAPDGDDGVAALARDAVRAVSGPMPAGGMTLDVGASVGIAVFPRDGRTPDELMRAAGIALTHARLAGGGRYRFYERHMGEELAAAEALKSELRGAIAAGRIVPYFQPIVRLSDGATAGFEVLARWEHPAKGVLPPAAFLDLVEQAGLSAAMFASVLAQACAATRDWPGAPALSVNLSPREMQSEALPDEMAAILRDQRFPGARIEVEVTENALIHDSRIVRGVVDRLRAQGMAIALDDFGTGYSSLYHLRELPFDKVKVDKAFVRPPGADPAGARYAAAIVGFCRALGFATTAEGIEDAETAAFLRELGCSFGQGYWFGRPMPAQAARAFAAGEAPTRVPAQAAE